MQNEMSYEIKNHLVNSTETNESVETSKPIETINEPKATLESDKPEEIKIETKTKSQMLRELFQKPSFFRIVGAHNGLSARLVEQAGFEGIWASSLEMSASHAVPDANILTMTDYLNIATSMNDAVSIPVVVDVDQGYGNSINVIRMIQKFEAAGIAGVIMEDKKFPKQNSLLANGRQELASIAEFVGKIMAAKNVQKSKDFMVMARVEALIAGWGHEEAMKRAKAYVKAGADGIMIHSKKEDPAEIVRFLDAWDLNVPIVIVPTSYYTLTEDKIKNYPNVKMVIYANHGIRAAVTGIKATLKEIAEHGGTHTVVPKLIPVKELFGLQGTWEMKAHEKSYVRTGGEPIKAIIPVAGEPKDHHLRESILKDTPTCMLDINGKTILQRHIDNLHALKITDVNIITGYCRDKINIDGVKKFENPEYQTTRELTSIMMAEQDMNEKTMIMFGDTIYERKIIEQLTQQEGDVTIVVDSSYRTDQFRSKEKLDLVVAKRSPICGERAVRLDEGDNYVLHIGPHVTSQHANFEFVGLAMFSREGIVKLKETYGKYFDELRNSDFTVAIQKMIDDGVKVNCLEVHKGWTEVHSFEDYKRLSSMITSRNKEA
jgi:phosphoenolpyruvate phosphomutase